MKKIILIICLLQAAAISINARLAEFPKLTGPYLGQKPPGMIPEIFAPGIISQEEFIEFKGAFSPDGKEYYFYRHSLPDHPCVSHDNQWLFFAWTFGRDQKRPSGYYVSERKDRGGPFPDMPEKGCT